MYFIDDVPKTRQQAKDIARDAAQELFAAADRIKELQSTPEDINTEQVEYIMRSAANRFLNIRAALNAGDA